MIKSMTGFGRGEYSDGKRNIIVEIKSVNHRYNDINIKISRRYSFAEEHVKNLVKTKVKRGKVDVMINIENITESDISIKYNSIIAHQYYDNLISLKRDFNFQNDITLEYLASLPEVMKQQPDLEDESEFLSALKASVIQAVDYLDKMRVAEGEKMAEDILLRGQLINETIKKVELRSPEIVKAYTEKLKDRISELLGDNVEIPEDRIMFEAAIFADKSNVTEELVRLQSHISQLGTIITKSSQPDGKRLDFLAQEMNREANTIGSKANDIDTTNHVVELKSEIEKIREQIQNIE